MTRCMVKRRRFFVAALGLFTTFLAYWGVQAYVGDVNYDDLINQIDLNIITAAFGSNQWTGGPAWNPTADLNEDDEIDAKDLAIAGRNYGSEHIFHQGRNFSNSGHTVYKLDACIDGQDQLHIAWSDGNYEDVYYTRLDRFGNTLIDDVLVDSGPSTGVDIIAVGCDKIGNAHIFWDCISEVCEARFDQWGYTVIEKKVVDDRWAGVESDAAAGIDSTGRAHLLYEMDHAHLAYAMFTPNGTRAVRMDEPLIGGDTISSRYRQLAIDGDDNVHLVWSEEDGADRLYYAKLAADSSTSIPATIIGETAWNGTVNDSHRPSLTVDTHGNALILWSRANPSQLFLEKIGADGSTLLDDYPIFSDWKAAYFQDLAVDQSDNIHLWAPTTWGHSTTFHAYGIFDNDGGVLDPMRWAMYGYTTSHPNLIIDSQDDVHLIYRLANLSMDDPPCPSNAICYGSTAFDSTSYDQTRPDLGVDTGHLSWSPTLARWGQTLVITTTVFNSGWVTSPETTAHFDIALNDDTVLDPPAQAEVAISALDPRQTQQITATLTLPTKPPKGYESIEYATLRVSVDSFNAISESTENNNQTNTPFMIQPLPTTAGLFLIVKDATQTVRGGGLIPLDTGTAQLAGNGIDREIPITAYVNILANDLPISDSVITYTIGWEEGGFSRPEPVNIGIVRNPSDPYQVDFNPSNTAVLETDTWGSLSGTVTELGSGNPLTATVRIQGQGIHITTTADASGQFSPSTEEKLGKLIPGQYTIYVSAVDHARDNGSVTVTPLGDHTWNKALDKSEYAYVRGSVVNQFDRPVSDAEVNACGTIKMTGSDGSFDLGEVHETCTTLEIDKPGYETVNQPMTLIAGLEEYFEDIEMVFDPPVDVIQDEGSLASWKQDESSSDLLPDPPEDAEWYEIELFDKFADEFWPSYRVEVWWGTYEYYLDAMYSGPVDDRHLYQTQLRLIPKTFEAHKVSGEIAEAELAYGQTIKFELSYFEDSGMTTALWVVEARLVDADSGTVISTVRNPIEGGNDWIALEDATRTYDFGGVAVDDWENAEVWLFIKVGKNEGNQWESSLILQGWHFDQQVLRFDLNEGTAIGDYMIVNFPIP